MAKNKIVICVPTYKRPQGLERCLNSLAALNLDIQTSVIVGDNDTKGRQGFDLCNRLAGEGFRFPLKAILVEDRGIAPNRNALVAEAIADPEVELIAMIDDDEWAHPDWLRELMAVQARYNVDVVGGPVEREFEIDVPQYVATANLPDYTTMPTGMVELVDATSSILLRASLFRERSAPWFDLQYALMGCEDRDILTGFMMEGKTFAWASRAIVTEGIPASRCSGRWMLQRSYRAGNTDTIVNMNHRPPGYTLSSEVLKVCGASSLALAKLVLFFWNPARRFEGALLGARVMGKIAAIFGHRHQEYRVTHGR